MSDYPTAEEELKETTERLWAQVEATEKVAAERDELRAGTALLREALEAGRIMAADLVEMLGEDDETLPESGWGWVEVADGVALLDRALASLPEREVHEHQTEEDLIL